MDEGRGMIDAKNFQKAVAEMRAKQKEYFKSKGADWSVKKIILEESKSLEQNVDRMLRVIEETEEES